MLLLSQVPQLEARVQEATGALQDSEARLLKLREEKHVLEGEVSGLRAAMERSESAERERGERRSQEILAKDQEMQVRA